MLTFIAAVTLALVGSFLCSIMESVLLSVSEADAESLVKEGKRSGELLKGFKRRIDVPIAAILIINTVAHTVGASVAGASYENAFSSETLWIFTIVFTIGILVFTEIIPKTLGVTYAKRLASPVAYGIQGLSTVLRPVIMLTELISSSLRHDHAKPVTSVEEIRLLALMGHKEGVFGARATEIIVGATRLKEFRVHDVMTPRQDVIFLSAGRSDAENMQVIASSGHSRLPWSTTAELDQFSGIILARELLLHVNAHRDEPIAWNALVNEPLVVPEGMRLNTLLKTFQEQRKHMAIAVDEYGNVEGIVTLEDVLEEIVGEIEDESDADVRDLWPRTDGSIDVLASVEVKKVADYFGIDWTPVLEVTSIGGLITEQLGRIPIKGDSVEWEGYRLLVLSATQRRAERLRVQPLTPINTDSAEEPSSETDN